MDPRAFLFMKRRKIRFLLILRTPSWRLELLFLRSVRFLMKLFLADQ